jgi:hypothetical protein
MNNNVAGMWPWSRTGLVLVEIACSRKSRAWTKRPSSVGGKNWRVLWQSDQPSGYVHLVRVAREQKKDVELEPALQKLVEPETAGDPMSEQKWVRSSLRSLSQRLKDLGHSISPPTVGRLLRKLGYSLRVIVKKQEASAAHLERNQQFEQIEAQSSVFKRLAGPSSVWTPRRRS